MQMQPPPQTCQALADLVHRLREATTRASHDQAPRPPRALQCLWQARTGRSRSARPPADSGEQRGEQLLAVFLAVGGSVVVLGLQDRAELDAGPEVAAGFADGLEGAVQLGPGGAPAVAEQPVVLAAQPGHCGAGGVGGQLGGLAVEGLDFLADGEVLVGDGPAGESCRTASWSEGPNERRPLGRLAAAPRHLTGREQCSSPAEYLRLSGGGRGYSPGWGLRVAGRAPPDPCPSAPAPPLP